jgi:hypothetical protein
MKSRKVFSALCLMGLAGLLGTPGILPASVGQTSGWTANPCAVETTRFRSAYGGCHDTVTNLVWSSNTSNPARNKGTFSTQGATTYASDLVEGGYSDWRLPSKNELVATVGPEAVASLDIFKSACYGQPGCSAEYLDHAFWSTTASGNTRKGGCKLRYQVQLDSGVLRERAIYDGKPACFDNGEVVCVRVAP